MAEKGERHMSIYVMSDIHGCYDRLMEMLKKIEFSPADQLILAGDYIDRGPQDYEMVNWILVPPKNVRFLCGNHDKEFAANVELMRQVMDINIKGFDGDSPEQTMLLYHLTDELLSGGNHEEPLRRFDYYGTIRKLIDEKGATLRQLMRWAIAFDKMPYFHQLSIRDRHCIIVHAGYIETVAGVPTKKTYASIEEKHINQLLRIFAEFGDLLIELTEFRIKSYQFYS